MNNSEGPKFRFSDINLIPSKRVSAGILAAGLAVTGVGFGGKNEVRAETKNSSSAIVATGEMLSQTAGFGSGGSSSETTSLPEAAVTISQVRDVIMNGSGTEPLSSEMVEVAKYEFEQWKKRTFGPYEEKLRAMEGVKEERVPFCARVWYCRDTSHNLCDNVYKFQDYLNEEDIFDYSKGGINENILCDNEGKPMVWMVIADKKMEKRAMKGVKEALKWYKVNKMPDMLDSASENGLSVFFVANTHPDRGADSLWLNEWGEACVNQSTENIKKIKDENIRNQYTQGFYVEPYGIKFYQTSMALNLFDNPFEEQGYTEVVKSLIAGYVAGNLKGVDKDGIYKNYAESFPLKAVNFADNYARYGVTVDGSLTKSLVNLMADFVRIPGFGTLENVSAYNEAMVGW